MKRILLSLVALATICIGTNAQEVFRLGIIGLDTSHSARFSQLLNDPESPDPIVRKFEVVVAYPYGTTTIESASKRSQADPPVYRGGPEIRREGRRQHPGSD